MWMETQGRHPEPHSDQPWESFSLPFNIFPFVHELLSFPPCFLHGEDFLGPANTLLCSVSLSRGYMELTDVGGHQKFRQ